MNPSKIETWVWILIYAGLGLAMLGLWSLQASPQAAPVLIGAGSTLVAVGLVLIVVRARMRTTSANAKTPPSHNRKGAP